jgi:riboflavin biosynthesis pyrimidine reductase
VFERLQPAGEPVAAVDILREAALGDRAPDDRPYVFFNFVSTLDGRAALDGSTRPLGGPADLEMLLSLRAIADAVLIGPGTIRAEGYGRLVGPQRRADVPPAVLISRRFDIPWDAGLFQAADQPVIICGPADAPEPPDVAAPVEVMRLDPCTPGAALVELRARGIRALLSEGGPTLFHGFLEAGCVDELFFTLTPVITGDEAETAIVSGARLPDPARMTLQWILRAEDELFLRYAMVR